MVLIGMRKAVRAVDDVCVEVDTPSSVLTSRTHPSHLLRSLLGLQPYSVDLDRSPLFSRLLRRC